MRNLGVLLKWTLEVESALKRRSPGGRSRRGEYELVKSELEEVLVTEVELGRME